MKSFILADWTTVRGQSASPASQVTQDETGWLDLEQYSDIVIYLDVREVSPGGASAVTFYFETAPSKDDPRDTNGNPTFFQALASSALVSASSTTIVLRALMLTASVPLARYVRWRVVGPASALWDATFRAIVAANGPALT